MYKGTTVVVRKEKVILVAVFVNQGIVYRGHSKAVRAPSVPPGSETVLHGTNNTGAIRVMIGILASTVPHCTTECYGESFLCTFKEKKAGNYYWPRVIERTPYVRRAFNLLYLVEKNALYFVRWQLK